MRDILYFCACHVSNDDTKLSPAWLRAPVFSAADPDHFVVDPDHFAADQGPFLRIRVILLRIRIILMRIRVDPDHFDADPDYFNEDVIRFKISRVCICSYKDPVPSL